MKHINIYLRNEKYRFSDRIKIIIQLNIKECNSAYGNLECIFHSENMRLEDAHEVQVSKIVPRLLIRSQQDNPSGNLTGICCNTAAEYLCDCLNSHLHE
jgi:hypothetical protein